MIPARRAIIPLAVFCCVLAVLSPVGAQNQTAVSAPADPRPLFERMARFLARAQQFQTTVRMGFDVRQESGQEIEFSERHRITIARPDRLRAELLKPTAKRV